MAAQGFLLVASFLLVLFVLARPLGKVLAGMINNTPLPGLARCESGLWRIIHKTFRGCHGIWRSIPPLALSVTPTGNPIVVKPP